MTAIPKRAKHGFYLAIFLTGEQNRYTLKVRGCNYRQSHKNHSHTFILNSTIRIFYGSDQLLQFTTLNQKHQGSENLNHIEHTTAM